MRFTKKHTYMWYTKYIIVYTNRKIYINIYISICICLLLYLFRDQPPFSSILTRVHQAATKSTMFFATWISFNENQRKNQNTYTPWNWQFSHENRPGPKRKFIFQPFQPSIFRGELLVPRRFQKIGWQVIQFVTFLSLSYIGGHLSLQPLKGSLFSSSHKRSRFRRIARWYLFH